jgi:hypothetical protein
MHAHVPLPLHPATIDTQCFLRPSCVTYTTHACEARSQRLQSSTVLHCVVGTHGPQHVPITDGVWPSAHSGGSDLHDTFV